MDEHRQPGGHQGHQGSGDKHHRIAHVFGQPQAGRQPHHLGGTGKQPDDSRRLPQGSRRGDVRHQGKLRHAEGTEPHAPYRCHQQ